MATTILIVDDSPTMRSMVRSVLEQDKHHVCEAPDGRSALTTVEHTPPDLVITDVNMPEMDGLALVRALRGRTRQRFTPILVLTTEHGDAMKQRGREAGATGWLVKPFDPEQLRSVVDRVLKAKRR